MPFLSKVFYPMYFFMNQYLSKMAIATSIFFYFACHQPICLASVVGCNIQPHLQIIVHNVMAGKPIIPLITLFHFILLLSFKHCCLNVLSTNICLHAMLFATKVELFCLHSIGHLYTSLACQPLIVYHQHHPHLQWKLLQVCIHRTF